jgi:chromosome segregation ATPase
MSLLAGSVASPAHGQTGDPSIDCRSLESVRSSIDQLTAALLEQSAAQTRRDEVQLAIAYLQYRSRRIESLEQELRRFEDRRSSAEQRVERLEGELEASEQRLDEMTSEEGGRWRQQIARLRRAIESEKDSLDRLDTRVIDLENEIIDGRRRLAAFEEFVLENLEAGD